MRIRGVASRVTTGELLATRRASGGRNSRAQSAERRFLLLLLDWVDDLKVEEEVGQLKDWAVAM